VFTPQSASAHSFPNNAFNYNGRENLRRSIGVEQDMSLFEFLWIRTVLEVFLEGVLAHMAGWADGRDGSLVDYGLA
jgi:hypothetical protein